MHAHKHMLAYANLGPGTTHMQCAHAHRYSLSAKVDAVAARDVLCMNISSCAVETLLSWVLSIARNAEVPSDTMHNITVVHIPA